MTARTALTAAPLPTVIHGDCLEQMAAMAAEGRRFDAVITDPPYHFDKFGYMGNRWDSTEYGVSFKSDTWKLAFDVLKPGGHMVVFSGSRTYHRMACAVEDAGFEIRDQIGWVCASGMPKSLDVSKAIDKSLGAVRKVTGYKKGISGQNINKLMRLGGNDDENARGCGAFGVGAKQISVDIPCTVPATHEAEQWDGWGTGLKPAWEPMCLARKPLVGTVASNVLQYGVGGINIDGCRIHEEGEPAKSGRWPANVVVDDALAEDWARFFYSVKASKGDRSGSVHPTVKPISLMRWLCRLITPPGGTILDPFAGSGTTLAAAHLEGFHATGIEQEAAYVDDIRRRIAALTANAQPALQGGLFDAGR